MDKQTKLNNLKEELLNLLDDRLKEFCQDNEHNSFYQEHGRIFISAEAKGICAELEQLVIDYMLE